MRYWRACQRITNSPLTARARAPYSRIANSGTATQTAALIPEQAKARLPKGAESARKRDDAIAFQSVPNVAQVEVRASLHGEEYENTYFYERATQPTEAELQELVEALADHVIAYYPAQLGDGWVGRAIYAKGLTDAEDVQAIDTSIAGLAGTATGGTAPGNVAIALKRTSGLTGRSSRGRIFWGGVPEEQQEGNTLNPVYVLSVLAVVEGFDDVAVALGWTPVIVSRSTVGAPRTTGVTFPITAWLADDFNIDSQRRRLAGRGV